MYVFFFVDTVICCVLGFFVLQRMRLLCAIFLVLAANPQLLAKPTRPHIIFIVADDLVSLILF